MKLEEPVSPLLTKAPNLFPVLRDPKDPHAFFHQITYPRNYEQLWRKDVSKSLCLPCCSLLTMPTSTCEKQTLHLAPHSVKASSSLLFSRSSSVSLNMAGSQGMVPLGKQTLYSVGAERCLFYLWKHPDLGTRLSWNQILAPHLLWDLMQLCNLSVPHFSHLGNEGKSK